MTPQTTSAVQVMGEQAEVGREISHRKTMHTSSAAPKNPYTANTADGGVSPGLDRTSAPSQLSFKQSQGGSSGGMLTASMGPGAMRATGAGLKYPQLGAAD